MAPNLAQSFEGYEHREVSNAALALALAYLEAKEPASINALASAERDTLEALLSGDRGVRSYGRFVELVDYVTLPSEILRKDLGPRDENSAETVDWGEVDRVKRSLADYLFATKYDEAHFGREALFAQSQFHHAAVLEAAQGHLVLALVLNAFADHFRQDFLAPGHFLAPKGISHDAIVKAVHDAYNRRGLDLYLRTSSAKSQLAELAEFLDVRRSPGPSGRTRLNASDVLYPCRVGMDGAQGMLKKDMIEMRGDDWLRLNSTTRKECLADQVELMVLSTALSIVDVIRSFADKLPHDSLHWRVWRPGRGSTGTGPEFYAPAGSEDALPAACALEHRPSAIGCLPFACYCPIARSSWGVGLGWVSTSVGAKSLSLGGRFETEWQTETDLIWVHRLPHQRLPEPDEHASRALPIQAFLGGAYSFSNDLRSFGPAGRVVLPILGRIPVQFSLGVQGKWFDSAGTRFEQRVDRQFRVGSELRFEAGFGLLFVGIGVGRDHRLDEAGALSPGWAMSTAISFYPPYNFMATAPKTLPNLRGR